MRSLEPNPCGESEGKALRVLISQSGERLRQQECDPGAGHPGKAGPGRTAPPAHTESLTATRDRVTHPLCVICVPTDGLSSPSCTWDTESVAEHRTLSHTRCGQLSMCHLRPHSWEVTHALHMHCHRCPGSQGVTYTESHRSPHRHRVTPEPITHRLTLEPITQSHTRVHTKTHKGHTGAHHRVTQDSTQFQAM